MNLARTEAKVVGAGRRPHRIVFLLPVLAFVGIAMALGVGLTRKPGEVPSALIGKPVPEFSLAPVQGRALGLSSNDLRGEVSLVNVFASWCTACRAEHAVLNAFAKQSAVPIYGLNYKDDADAARAWLKQMGDPYVTSLIDADGKVGIDYGVYGVPETFVIDRAGVVRYRQVGPVTAESMERRIAPLLQQLEQEGGHA